MALAPRSTRPPAASGWSPANGRLTSTSIPRDGARRRAAPRDRAVLFVLRGPQHGEVFRLYRQSTVIGRGEGADVRLTEDTVSREHVRLTLEQDGVYLEDLGSRNGTTIGDRTISA